MEPARERQVRASERVPLQALVELRCSGEEGPLQADAIDVSADGVALRAAFLPPVGVRMECGFDCPPLGERVRAEAQVVWAHWEGPQSAAFGMRFMGLDTRSATVIRRLFEPADDQGRAAEPSPEPPVGIAELHIQGLSAPVEAELRLDQQDRLVLQQALPFLRLGRRVQVCVPGRDPRSGRIAAVELQQSADQVPSLTFGVLLDGAPAAATVDELMPSAEASRSGAGPDSDVRELAPGRARERVAEEDACASALHEEEEAQVGPPLDAADTWREPPGFVESLEEGPSGDTAPGAPRVGADAAVEAGEVPLGATARAGAGATGGTARRAPRAAAQDDSLYAALGEPDDAALATPPQGPPAFVRLAAGWLGGLRRWAANRLASARERGAAALVRLRAELLPGVRQRAGQAYGRGREEASARLRALGRMRKRPVKRRTTSPPPRASNVGAARRGAEASTTPPRLRGRMVLAGLFGFAGVGLAVYALAPRPRADELPLRRPLAPAPAAPPRVTPTSTPAPAPALTDANANAAAASAQPVKTAPEAAAAAAAQASSPASAEPPAAAPPSASVEGKRFGAAKVPRGRTYTLRMNHLVERLEGTELERGFVVRVPGALSLDRASPIAISHGAVARSMILNRGDHAELTIEFVPGKKPAYQVQAKGRTLEITLERL